MDSLEFTTKIEDGVIHLPKEFEEYENAITHVSITIEKPEDLKTKKENLRKAFKKAQKAGLFAEIENPCRIAAKIEK